MSICCAFVTVLLKQRTEPGSAACWCVQSVCTYHGACARPTKRLLGSLLKRFRDVAFVQEGKELESAGCLVTCSCIALCKGCRWLGCAPKPEAACAQVVDHYDRPRNVGSFDKTDASVGTGLVGAPACGDVMKLQIKARLLPSACARQLCS